MNFRNIGQETYDRIREDLRPFNDKWGRRVRTQDALELLEAYEAAVTLLDQLVHTNHDLAGSDFLESVDAFLYLPDRYPRIHRVIIDDGEPLTYSARGELRPAEVDSEDY